MIGFSLLPYSMQPVSNRTIPRTKKTFPEVVDEPVFLFILFSVSNCAGVDCYNMKNTSFNLSASSDAKL